jgi:ADP-dependent NAD(P)H-hydrate dehydratase
MACLRAAVPRLISPTLLADLPLPSYIEDTNKTARGKLLVIAGARRLPGVTLLACRAAFRAGAGTVAMQRSPTCSTSPAVP